MPARVPACLLACVCTCTPVGWRRREHDRRQSTTCSLADLWQLDVEQLNQLGEKSSEIRRLIRDPEVSLQYIRRQDMIDEEGNHRM